jgi:hypothetical protein
MAGKRQPSRIYRISGVLGGILLLIGCIWLAWLLLHPHASGGQPSSFTIPGFGPTAVPEMQVPPLLAEGIVLGHASQQPALSQQQALFIADQLEPDAAAKAKSVSARYVLLTYNSTVTPAAHPPLRDVPVWIVWYQKIPLEATNSSVDPTPFPQATHDLYVFLDASSGKELMAVWT